MNSLGATGKTSTPPGPPWTETFGNGLCGMSRALGMSVEELALCVASVLTNVAGPLSGIGTKQGGGIAGGINLIDVGGCSHRSQRLAEHLFQPLFALQDFTRHSAHRTSKMWGELYLSGPDTLKAWEEALRQRPGEVHSRLIEMLDATVKDLKTGDCLPQGWDSPVEPMPDFSGKNIEKVLRERVPGFRHLPSFVLRPGEIGEFSAMMADVADQHAFVVDPEGRLFDGSAVENASKRAAWMLNLAHLMGGKDVAMPRIHKDQGHGGLIRGRATVFSSMSIELASEFLSEDRSSAERVIVEEAILWKPTWRVVSPLPDGFTPWVWTNYKNLLERVVNDRASRTGTVIQHTPASRRELEVLDIEMVQRLDEVEPALHRYLRPFGTLVHKLTWAFSLFGVEGTALPNAIRATMTCAINGHVSTVRAALSQVETLRVARLVRQIQTVLKAKGPCTAREIQRSMFQSRRSDIDVGLEQLIGAGQVVYVAAKREYHIPSTTGAGRNPIALNRTSTLNTDLHG